MKNFFSTIFIVIILLLSASFIYSQTAGDYRSIASGNYGDAATWETYDGANWVAATTGPSTDNNVTVQIGDTVFLDGTKHCNNLTIDSGGVLNGDASASISSPRSFRIHGTAVLVNGTLGDAAGGTVNLEFDNDITISGSGTFSTSRVRAYNAGYTCTFDMDAKLFYSGSSGTGGYGLQGYKDNTTYVINAGKTLSFDTYSGISGGSGGSAVAYNITLNVYGTIDLSSSGSNLTLKMSAGSAGVLNIYSSGTVTVGGNINFTDSSDGGSATLLVDGSLVTTGVDDYGVASMSGTGTITHTEALNAPSAMDVGGLGAVITSVQDLGSIQVVRGFTVQTSGSNSGIMRWYDITPTNNTALDATLVFNYNESELNGIAEANLGLFKSTDGGTNWMMVGGTVDADANTVTASGINSFSRWTLGDVTAPLPVELSSFAANTTGNSVELRWITQTETNTKSFEIQRSDGNNWVKISDMKANGTTSEVSHYSFVDKNLLPGTYNYRLKIIDENGTFRFSKTIEAVVSAPAKFSLSQNYPNPFNPVTKLSYELPFDSKVNLSVFNMLGQKVMDVVNEFQNAGTYERTIDASTLSSGIYIYQLSANNIKITKRMILLK